MTTTTANPTPEQIERLQSLASELRCLVCQNQSIAESNAGLAIDLKEQALEQIQAGNSDADIRTYMVERYGEFILYKPAFSASNAALWSGPFLLLLVVMVFMMRGWRRCSSWGRGSRGNASSGSRWTRRRQSMRHSRRNWATSCRSRWWWHW